jgi:hypothetical protein
MSAAAAAAAAAAADGGQQQRHMVVFQLVDSSPLGQQQLSAVVLSPVNGMQFATSRSDVLQGFGLPQMPHLQLPSWPARSLQLASRCLPIQLALRACRGFSGVCTVPGRSLSCVTRIRCKFVFIDIVMHSWRFMDMVLMQQGWEAQGLVAACQPGTPYSCFSNLNCRQRASSQYDTCTK